MTTEEACSPRRGPPAPEDIAAVWLRLSERQRVAVTRSAADAGLTIEMHIRNRWAICAAALFGLRRSQITPQITRDIPIRADS